MSPARTKGISWSLQKLMNRDGFVGRDAKQRLATEVGVDVVQVRRWCRGAATPRQSQMDALCALFDCRPDTLFAQPDSEVSFDRYSFDEQTVLAAQRALGPTGEVFIVSDNGFLEEDDDEIVGVVLESVKRGTRYTYVFPLPGWGSRQPEDSDWQASESFTKAKSRVLRAASTSELEYAIDERMVRGVTYDPTISGFTTGSGVFVLHFSEKQLRNLFQYVVCAPLRSDTPKTVRRWLNVPMEEANALWEKLSMSIVPVVDGVTETNRLDSDIQVEYRRLFGDRRYLEDYQALRQCIVGPEETEVAGKAIENELKRARSTHSDFVNILEIGPGDFEVSYRLLYDRLRRVDFHVIGVESSTIRGSKEYKDKSNAVYSRPNKPFESWQPAPLVNKFDLVLAVHSLYLIDPNNIWKMLAVLHARGTLAILHSPLAGNVFNTISMAVDDVIGFGVDPYDGKVVTEDAYRVYAEDLESWFASSVCRVEVDRIPLAPKVALRGKKGLFTDEGVLTETGKKVVDYFVGELDDEIFQSTQWQKGLYERLAIAVGTGPNVTSHEVLYLVKRPKDVSRFLLERAESSTRRPYEAGGGES